MRRRLCVGAVAVLRVLGELVTQDVNAATRPQHKREALEYLLVDNTTDLSHPKGFLNMWI